MNNKYQMLCISNNQNIITINPQTKTTYLSNRMLLFYDLTRKRPSRRLVALCAAVCCVWDRVIAINSRVNPTVSQTITEHLSFIINNHREIISYS